MSSTSSDLWLALLDEKMHRLHRRASKRVSAIGSENAFRTAFEDIGKSHKEKYTPRLLYRVSPSFENIITFAEAVAAPIPDLHSEALVSFVWGISFALIEEGSRTKAKLEYLVKVLLRLNKAVPEFEPDNKPFAEDPELQKPLQSFFSVYVDTFSSVLAEIVRESVLTSETPISEKSLQTHVDEASKKYEDAKVEYMAVLDEEKERRKANNQFGLNDDRPRGKIHSYGIHAQFKYRHRLGRGSFSQVDEVEETSTGDLYACKRVYLDVNSPTAPDGLEQLAREEVNIMRKLRHQHIASVLFGNKDLNFYNIFMVPIADCNLRRYLEHCTESGYEPAELNPIFQWFGCIIDALNHAHNLSIKHRDIKPSNILIKDRTPFLADFGLAKDFSEQDSSFSDASMVEGTPQYFAPEYQPGERYGRSADVFALGCVFSEMLTVANYKSLDQYKHWRRPAQATQGSFAFRDSLPKVREWLRRIEKSQLNDILVHQTLGMLHQDPEQRPPAQEGVHTLSRHRALFCKVCQR